jgi:Spy/CpxP family protein refolding chaperone
MRRLVLVFATLALASPAFAAHDFGGREPRFEPGRFEERLDARADRVAGLLDLTDDQRASFEALRARSLSGARAKLARMHDLGEELRALLDAAAPDATQVGAKAIALHRLREELRAGRESFEAEVAEILTAEQRFAFEALREARGELEERGPGGFRPRHRFERGDRRPEPPID